MKEELLEIGTWLRDETMSVEDVASKAYAKLGIDDHLVRSTWAKLSLEIKEADWPKFAAMSGMMWQEMVAGERYEVFKGLLCKKITNFWMDWIEERRRDQNSGNRN